MTKFKVSRGYRAGQGNEFYVNRYGEAVSPDESTTAPFINGQPPALSGLVSVLTDASTAAFNMGIFWVPVEAPVAQRRRGPTSDLYRGLLTENEPPNENIMMLSLDGTALHAKATDEFEQAHNDKYRVWKVLTGSIEPPTVQRKRSWTENYPWLKEARRLEAANLGDKALRVVYKRINGLLMEGESGIAVCDRLLEDIQVNDLSVDFLLAFLSLTLRFHKQLRHRSGFFGRVSANLRERGLSDRPLLNGLG